jgi:hypothetical protein
MKEFLPLIENKYVVIVATPVIIVVNGYSKIDNDTYLEQNSFLLIIGFKSLLNKIKLILFKINNVEVIFLDSSHQFGYEKNLV